MRPIGFSTGALSKGDFQQAITLLRQHQIPVVELSALRTDELTPLMFALRKKLDLSGFNSVSIHAPSSFEVYIEDWIVDQLRPIPYPIVTHPNTLFTPALWRGLGNNLLIENMDSRKPSGKTVREFQDLFETLPHAKFCFDVGHAYQVDSSMSEAVLFLRTFKSRLAEVHISYVNPTSQHEPLTPEAIRAFQSVAPLIPEETPIIIESPITHDAVLTELQAASDALKS